MGDKAIAGAFLVISLTVMMLSVGLAAWLVVKLRRKSDQPLSQDMTGVMVVPVRLLRRTFGFLGQTKNGLSPRLEIVPDGLRFKIFKPDYWTFSEIAEVDVRKRPLSTQVSIRNQSGDYLFVHVADNARGRDFLLALPPQMPFTSRAIGLRDGSK